MTSLRVMAGYDGSVAAGEAIEVAAALAPRAHVWITYLWTPPFASDALRRRLWHGTRRVDDFVAAVEREGAAEAAAIKARGNAEAEAMQAKAEAFERYGEAAVLDLIVQVLPQVVQAASAPMSAVDKMTVISTDGASSLTKSVAANVATGLQLGSDLTGVDVGALLGRLAHRTNEARPEPGEPVHATTAVTERVR